MALASPLSAKQVRLNHALAEAAAREIADIEARDATEARIKQEIYACYQEHTPEQLNHAGGKMRAHAEMQLIHARVANGEMRWHNIGRSCGGKRKRNLYVCLEVV